MCGTALITGTSRGLGKEIANVFSKNGWSVISGVDVTDRIAIQKIMTGIHRLDVVINNAGINKDALLLRTSIRDWERIIAVNLTGVFNICREAVRIMQNTGGHIVNISSMAGVIGRAGQCAYSSSKAGLIGFSKALAREVSRWNIKVNVILPGYMKTNMLSEYMIDRAKEENLLRRINEPLDIARFIYQLVHTDFISGQVFNLDSRVI